MANFIEAYSLTMKNEGGWGENKEDSGGETYKGIARKFHPNWSGWPIIDAYKSKQGFPNIAYKDSVLDSKVKEFYKIHYWDINKLDDVSSQMIANDLFDSGVNMGVGTAGKFLQQTLNFLNKNGKMYADISEDGKVGSGTIGALNTYLSLKDESYVYKILNILQGNRYLEIMKKDPTQETFAYGWLDRVEFIKK